MLRSFLMLVPVLLLVAVAFWFIFPSKSRQVIVGNSGSGETSDFSNLKNKVDALEQKVTSLESSNSGLLTKINLLESIKAQPTYAQPGKKSPVLLPINPGGSVNSTTWTNLTSGSITIDPANYPGYKNAYLIINLSVNVGQGTAYARLVNTSNTLAIIPSTVSTSSYFPVTLTSQGFQLPSGSNNYTIQLYTQVPGYPAQAADSFLQITY